jgi:hypothetical protein
VEVLDRVLDKGVVVIASIGVSVAGLRLVDVHARVVVSSIDTYITRSDEIEAAAHPRPLPPREALPTAVDPMTPRGVAGARSKVRPSTGAARRRRARPLRELVKCSNGCTFGRDAVDHVHGTIACPYRRGVRCSVQAAS